jgi:sugar/nucleoside kinase (ribokinase family)
MIGFLKPVSICICGNLTLDELTRSSNRKILPGGSAMFAGVAAAYLGARVGIIGNVGRDYPQSFLKRLESYRIDLSRLERNRDPSTRFRINSPNGTRKLFLLEPGRSIGNQGNVGKVDGVHLGPVFGEISDKLVRKLRSGADFMSADLQGFVRNATRTGRVYVRRRNVSPLLKTCDMVQASIEEVGPQAGRAEPDDMLSWLLSSGPKYSILTLGVRGSLIGIRPHEIYRIPAFKDTKIIDTTGAGDVFAGSWLSTFLSTKDPVWAASVGSSLAALASRKTGWSKFRVSKKELFRRAVWVYNHVKAV